MIMLVYTKSLGIQHHKINYYGFIPHIIIPKKKAEITSVAA